MEDSESKIALHFNTDEIKKLRRLLWYCVYHLVEDDRRHESHYGYKETDSAISDRVFIGDFLRLTKNLETLKEE